MNKEEVRMYEKAIESNMYYFNAHYNLAMSYSGNNWSRMAEELRKAEEINPDFKELHYNLGIACENTGDSGNAINEYEKEIEINPEYASSYKNVGILYYSRGDKKKTVYNWKKYLQLNPVAPDAEIIKAEIKKLNNINSR
jgi:tetratricopeptide (TPR) repeat protein